MHVELRREKGRAGSSGAHVVLIATKTHPLHVSQSSRFHFFYNIHRGGTTCSFCHRANTKSGTLSQHFVTHVVPPLQYSYTSSLNKWENNNQELDL